MNAADFEGQRPQYELADLSDAQLRQLVMSYQDLDRLRIEENIALTEKMMVMIYQIENCAYALQGFMKETPAVQKLSELPGEIRNIVNHWTSRNAGVDNILEAVFSKIIAGPGKAN